MSLSHRRPSKALSVMLLHITRWAACPSHMRLKVVNWWTSPTQTRFRTECRFEPDGPHPAEFVVRQQPVRDSSRFGPVRGLGESPLSAEGRRPSVLWR